MYGQASPRPAHRGIVPGHAPEAHPMNIGRIASGVLGLAVALGGCAGSPLAGPPAAPERTPDSPRSNIVRADYAGSAECAGCHPAIYEAWRHSPMHNMTRLPNEARIRAPFDGRTVRFKDDEARLEQRGDQRFMHLRSPGFGDHSYLVTKVIGGHHREDFAGVEVASVQAPPAANPPAELI